VSESTRLRLLAQARERLQDGVRGKWTAPRRLTQPAGAAQATPALDVVVTPNEMNDLHGTGFLVKRVFAGQRGILSLRIRDDYGGVQDFGDEARLLKFDAGRRPEAYAAALDAVAGRPVRAVYAVPYTSADLLLAMAVSDVTGAPTCIWEMDDQCVALPKIPRPLMREFLEKCRLRLATHSELRDAYEGAFGLPFGVLPAVVPAHLVRPGAPSRATPGAPGALLGSVWSRAWLDRLAAALTHAGETLDWYGNHQAPSLQLSAADLATMPLRAHGVVAEPALAEALLEHPFVVVPTDALEGSRTEHTAIAELSLPGRILFAVATAQVPVLVVGSDRTPAAAFVQRHGIGRVVPYDGRALAAAVEELRDPDVQTATRARAKVLGPALSDAGVGEWLRGSIEDGRPRDDRFERIFPREGALPVRR
jgi:hypothetical protein